ncbi:MAG: hypothetical protein AB2L21_10880 [Anaerolineaceae bacterium]
MEIFIRLKKAVKSPLQIFVIFCFICGIFPSLTYAASSNDSMAPASAAAPLPGMTVPPAAAPTPATNAAPEGPPSLSPAPPEKADANEFIRNKLYNPDFTYSPKDMLDPFVSFIKPAGRPLHATEGELDDTETDLLQEQMQPLTPLQKMSIPEIERGLSAITWGSLGRRAVIEDASGNGFIVSVGTPVGDRNGRIAEIYKDRLVIQQQYWDRKAKRMIPQNYVVKLRKEPGENK